MSHVEQISSDPVSLTLVHGTWGRGFFPRNSAKPQGRRPFWFQSRSRFVSDLSARLSAANIDFVIHEFLWPGSNSFFVRSDAARRLALDLNRRHRDNPNSAQFVIGHSHGGTVAMLACKDLDEDNKPNLIALATPFVELGVELPSDRLLKGTLSLVGFIALYITLLTLPPILSLGARLFGYSSHDVPAVHAFVSLTALATTFVGFFALLLYLAVGAQISRDPWRLIGKLREEAWGGLKRATAKYSGGSRY